MANHASTRMTQLYDRRRDELVLDEVERIVIGSGHPRWRGLRNRVALLGLILCNEKVQRIQSCFPVPQVLIFARCHKWLLRGGNRE
jgi:hypothetical protein